MSYAVSIGHGSPRSLSSRRWWTRTFRPGAGLAAGPGPDGAGSSAVAAIVADRPSLEAAVRSPGRRAEASQSVTRPRTGPNPVRPASHPRVGGVVSLQVDAGGQPTCVHSRQEEA